MAINFDAYIAKAKKKDQEQYQQMVADTKQRAAAKTTAGRSELAPVKTTTKTKTTTTKKKDSGSTWLKKGSYFDDGYDRWDLTKTILGSVADVGENIGTGIIGMGEKVTDALAVVGTALSEAQTRRATFETMSSPFALSKKGNEFASGLASMNYALLKNNKKTASEFVIKDLYDEEKIAKAIISAPIKSLTGMDVESASVFGEKSDALVQSAGQLLATAGLQVAGVPWFLATGATSFGAEAEGAFKEGATFEQGAVSAAISAGAEILSEKLSGGIKFGGKTLDDVLLKPLTEKITNKVAKTLVNLGADAFGEGFEEVFSGVVSNLGSALYKEESIGELLASEEAFDEYLESFIGGMVLGGGSSTVNAVASRNSIELSENEQKVVDKEIENLIAEKEAVKENLFPMLDESEVATDQKTEQRPNEEILGESQVKAGNPKKNKDRMWPSFVRNFVSKGSVFETFALQTKNRAVEDKYKMWKDRSEAKAQYFMENGKGNTKSLKAIRDQITKSGLEKEFDLYMKHRLNVDRMKEDKPVFGYDITAEASLKTANKLQEQHPEFKEWAKDVYAYNDYLRQMMVDGGLLTQETADLWAKKYPNYIPIERLTDESVKRGGKGVGISAPIKKSTGGNSTMETLLNTLAHRTTQVFKAIDKNAFGVELKNALYTDEVVSDVTADEIIDNVPLLDDGSLIKPGVDGNAPTFTVFENGKRVTFNIKEEMYEALKPTPEGLSKTLKVPHTASSWHKKVLTEYNLFFTARNFPKDAQEVIFNSRHAAKTYANMPVAFKELLTGKGKYVQEYWENGGKSNTYFDREANAFENEKGKIKKALGFVPDQISKVNDFVEAIPRLAEYIASRKKGATIEASMLDAARVTTDFSDGGDITKFLNRNGATFLNASVQGAAQQVRNIRQAKAEGFKGIMKLIGKYALSGLPVLLFNNLIWDDDEEYEELSEYVKDNYYVIAKYGDGKFVRIPKGRTAAVLQDAVEQISNTVTGKESDWLNCLELLTSNLAPNNPIDNNIFAPLIQAKKGETWYGEDLVPARLQKLPAREQYDEAIDSISKWLGENTGISPYKINYVLNQYSGFVGDMVLPALTPEAENGNNSFLGNMIAPLKDQFTTDSVLKNNAPSDFFSLSDELEINSNSKNATDEDKLKYKYISSVSSEISDLYKQKREIQNSDLSDKLKFEQVRDIQKQINETAKKALNGYEDVKIDKRYAKVGGIQYRFNDEGEWQKLTDEQLKKQKEVTGILGITPGEYWSNKDVYDMKALKPELYKALQEEGVSVKHYKENIEKWIHLPNDDYSWAANNPDKATFSKAFYDSVVDYRKMTSELYDIKADKDEDGNSISGSAKEKKKAYIWSLDIPEGAKHLLFRSEYNSYDDYNAEIIEYVKGLKLTTGEKKTVLEKAGFKVEDNGRITWD